MAPKAMSIISDTIALFGDDLNFTALTPASIIAAMLSSLLCGVIIYLVYRFCYRGVVYSDNFNIRLVMITSITGFIIMTISSNVVLSLGMVGALSIVRFRTAIKEPMDIAFLFWAIAVGIVLAAGMIPLAVFGSLFIGIIILIFANRKDMTNPFIVVLECDGHESEEKALDALRQHTRRCTVKSKTARKGAVELNLEVRLRDTNTDFINELSEMEGVRSAVLVSYNGDYMG